MRNYLFVVFVVILLWSPAIFADKPDKPKKDPRDGRGDTSDTKDRRTLDIDMKGKFDSTFTVKSKSANQLTDSKTRWDIAVNGKNQLDFRITRFIKGSNDTQFTRFRLTLDRIVEYVKSDVNTSDWRYIKGDTTGFNYEIGKNGAQTISFDMSGPDANGTITFNGTSSDGVIGVIMVLSTQNVSVRVNGSSRALSPSQSKFDLWINVDKIPGGFKLNNSRVAIVGHSKSADLVSYGNRTDQGPCFKYGAENDSYSFFNWAETVTINGNDSWTAPVIASPITPDDNDTDKEPKEKSRNIAFGFNFIQPKVIYWDPIYGVETFDATDGSDIEEVTSSSSSSTGASVSSSSSTDVSVSSSSSTGSSVTNSTGNSATSSTGASATSSSSSTGTELSNYANSKSVLRYMTLIGSLLLMFCFML